MGVKNLVTQRAWLMDEQLLKTCKGIEKGSNARCRAGIRSEPIHNYPVHQHVVESLTRASILGNILAVDASQWDKPSQMRRAKSCSASIGPGAGRLKWGGPYHECIRPAVWSNRPVSFGHDKKESAS